MSKLKLVPPKIADDTVNGEIRAAIVEHYILDGKPAPKENWLYSRLVEAHAQLRVMDGALALAGNLAAALKPLIPQVDSVSGEEKDKWQKVINVIFESAEYADRNGIA
jgi:hypothetical protein